MTLNKITALKENFIRTYAKRIMNPSEEIEIAE
jgi:hypothetical protein